MMMKTAKKLMRFSLLILSLVLLASFSVASQSELPPSIAALKKYILEKDYPEVLGNNSYHARIENVLEADIDNDGKNELVVQFFPHYRQSASVVIYKLSPLGEISRVAEALAPGPLQKISGDYLDSHALGSGVDLTLGQGQVKSGDKDKFFQIAGERFGGLVAYNGFYHMDGRKGPLSYIDMTSAALPANAKSCESFEFSRVRQIAAGHIGEDAPKNYLAVWVGDEIYVYLIRAISVRGMLDKKLWVMKVPADFQGFIPGQGLAYKTLAGTSLLTLPN